MKKVAFNLLFLSLVLILSGCGKNKVVDEINIGHDGRSTEQVKVFMLGIFSEDIVFNIDDITLDISFGLNSDFIDDLEELGFVTSSDSEIIIYVHWADTNNGYSLRGNHETIESIPNLQILVEYNIEDFLERDYIVSYSPKGFLGDKGKTTFNHKESFTISKDFVQTTNYTGMFTIGIAIVNYESDRIQVIVTNQYEFRFGDILDDLVYIRYWYDANENNMG
ncbi:hypothetical protein IY230_00705 [Acholeplasma laidlawii]|uniref:hypothetical protein n=1 Tax=Acholeplasma laidlawii TaxID=2148 RepID=UPI0018C29935|nr:hypothetical protein [Acholeplasma laidlawii]MBG0762132.1 hypothetical protein [Acholeplasma laidlawii]